MKGSMPQEVEVWYVIPAIRSNIAENLLKLGMKQKEIADVLGITEAAVSQYLGGKRASGIKFDQKVKNEIKKISKKIYVSKKSASQEISKLLDMIRDTKALCKIHEKYGAIEKNCNICKK